MIKLTEKQHEAVFSRGSDLLVSAAAGSGKTAVLSERILQAILNRECPASVTDFLIVTFTNAAAAEMKDRIGKKIMEAAADESLDKEMKAHLRLQLSLLSKASIATIHSFCLDIVRNNFRAVDIEPAVRVADASETKIIKMQVSEEMLEQMYASDGNLFSEICKWLGDGKDENLIEILQKTHEFLCGFPYPMDWLEEKVEMYNPENYKEISEVGWLTELKENAKQELDYLAELARRLISDMECEGIDSYANTQRADLATILHYRKLFDGDTKEILGYMPAFDKIEKKPKDADAELCKALKERRDDIKEWTEAVAAGFSFTEETFFDTLKKLYPRLKCIQKAIVTFDRIYKEKKKKAAIIDYNDFEHLALQILSDPTNGVADELRERYKEIMIDEYQDCNRTQELIFSYINRKIDGKSSNMFMVGDIKQSIYRFRQADPDIFAEKNKTYQPDGLQKKIVLNKNFRSSATILDGINSVFEKIMTEGVGGVEYSDDEKLYFRSENPDKESEHKCELVVVDPALSDAEERDADYIAERIIGLVESGYDFKDIAILLRSAKSKLSTLENALKKRNIPYYADGGNGYFDSVEVGILTSMLKVIDNPLQDNELVALLKSPVFKFDENLLALIRLEKKGPFYGALLKFAASDNENSQKCSEFLNRLEIWRDKVLFMPVDEFIEYLISDSGLDVFASALPGGQQRVGNLKLFVLRARLLQNSGFKGLFSFVNFMDKLSESKDSPEAQLLSESSNVVRIMTIHKSKGLEFPVVFVYKTDSEFNMMDTKKRIIFHKKAGIGVNFFDAARKIRYPFVSHNLVKDYIARDSVSEEMRVLYVALTRAKERLICTATLSDAREKLKTKISDKNVLGYLAANAKCYLDWIKLGLDENWQLQIVSPADIAVSVLEEENEKLEQTENTECLNVSEIFGYKYPFEAATKLPSKISVSEVKRRKESDDAGEIRLYMPEIAEYPVFMTEEKISAADIGIINHLVLRHINLAQPDVDKCVSALLDKGLIAQKEAGYVNKDGIEAFFKSTLGQRLCGSTEVYRELSFEIDLPANALFDSSSFGDETVMIQGIIDLAFAEGEEIVLVDYKTDKYIDAERKKMYQVQLELYERAIEKVLGKKVKARYLYLLTQGNLMEM